MRKPGMDLRCQVVRPGSWICAASWYWELVLGASKGLVVRTFADDADVLLGAIGGRALVIPLQIWLCEVFGLGRLGGIAWPQWEL